MIELNGVAAAVFPASPRAGALARTTGGLSTPEERLDILLVDDRPENLMALEATLQGPNQNLVLAGSGREALRHLLGRDFAVILLDVQMPGMDGFETARLIREREKSRYTPIIFLTAVHKSEEHVIGGYAAGAVDYVFKPFVPEVVRAKVAAFVELFRITRNLQLEVEQRRRAEQQLDASNALLKAISQALVEFIARRELSGPGERLLERVLPLAQSEYGFIAEFRAGPGKEPALTVHATARTSRGSPAGPLAAGEPTELDFPDLKALRGALQVHQEPFMVGEPGTAALRLGLPTGHPPLRNLLGLPVYCGETLTGLIGLANRPGGYDGVLVDYLGAFRSTCACLIEAYRNEQRRRLAEQHRERQVRLEQEIAIGQAIQRRLLPPTRLCLPGCEILSRSEPAAEVGGDFCNVFAVRSPGRGRSPSPRGDRRAAAELDPAGAAAGAPERLGILLGDVSGKGIPAALFMAVTTTLIQGQAQFVHSPAETLAAANAAIYLKLRQQSDGRWPLFATALYSVLDLERREIRLTNAGQAPPIYWPASGEPRYLRLKGVPLGALSRPTYREERLQLTAGDRFLFYSDGFTEAPDPAGQPLGYARFLQQVRELDTLPGPDLVNALFDRAKTHDRSTVERDDRTLVLITVSGTG